MSGSLVRPLQRADVPALRALFRRMPEADRTFFREDVGAEGVIESWLDGSAPARSVAVAVEAGQVTGYVAVVPHIGLSSHVGDLRVVVDPDRRRSGVGRQLARQGLLEGLGLGLTKIVVEVAAEQEPAISLFRDLGFDVEALLKDHVRGRDGEVRDILLLSHFVDDTRATMWTTRVDEAVDT